MAVVALSVFGAGTAIADIIFGSETVDYSHAVLSDLDAEQEVVGMFMLEPGRNHVGDVHWWGAYFDARTPTEADQFTIRIYGGSESGPDLTPLFEYSGLSGNRQDTGDDVNYTTGLNRIFAYSADIPLTSLSAGAPYWIAILNDTTLDADDDWRWIMAGNVPNGGVWFRTEPEETWYPSSGALAFYLTDAVVPEPASSTLLLFGIASLATLGRRRRRNVRT